MGVGLGLGSVRSGTGYGIMNTNGRWSERVSGIREGSIEIARVLDGPWAQKPTAYANMQTAAP